MARGGGRENPKAAVLLVRFFDKHGSCLGSGDLVPSEIFKCGYMYLPSNRDFKRCVVIPKDGTRAEFRVVRFSSGSSLKLKDLRVLSGM